MSLKIFTAAEIKELRENPYVKSVTKRSVILTSEFKEAAFKELNSGRTIRQIFKEYGFDVDVLGETRINGYCERIRNAGEAGSDFKDNRANNKHREAESSVAKMAKKIKQLEHRTAYLEQENEFLKKIQLLEEEYGGNTVNPK